MQRVIMSAKHLFPFALFDTVADAAHDVLETRWLTLTAFRVHVLACL